MKKNMCLFFHVICALAVLSGHNALAASKSPGKQSALQKGTTVRTKTQVSGLYDQACYDAYYGCMDQFCISENDGSGSCACSDLSIEYDAQLAEIQEQFDRAENIATIEVEKVKAGANADIIFGAERRYDKDGNILDLGELTEEEKRQQEIERVFATNNIFDDEEECDDISCLRGSALLESAEELCLAQIPESCDGDIPFLQKLYAKQIVSDCQGYANSIAEKRDAADLALADANADLRNALKDSLAESNKYDLGQCMVQFKQCMQTTDACGVNWENCVSEIANQNAENVSEINFETNDYNITPSTLDALNTKRLVCENVLSQCVAVRDMVWPAFLRDVAPTLKIAESFAESRQRQSCLDDISDCVHNACADDIAAKGVDTMDACLSRPEMARSFCKVEIDRCERIEPMIWGYVKDKLAAMRIDACTQEVKDCFTADTRCGENFQNCIGMDYDYIHNMCPIDSLVVCKGTNSKFSMDDLDSMLMGLYLNVDNSLLSRCQEIVEQKMLDVCGSTTDCNKFASDTNMGSNSLRVQKDGDIYRITGMISFGSIKIGDVSGSVKDANTKLGVGEIGVLDYMQQVRARNAEAPNAVGILATIEEELENIAGTINRTIDMIASDPEIQYCVSGRNMNQIIGATTKKTEARFPNLLNQVKMQIAMSALRQAQDNYNAKFNELVANAARDASADVAQYQCQMMPKNADAINGNVNAPTALAKPFAISYDVANGLNVSDLTSGGHDTYKISNNGGTREMWATFNRDTRVCHFCTSTVTRTCETTNKKGFLGIGAKDIENCTESEPVEKCEDIQM